MYMNFVTEILTLLVVNTPRDIRTEDCRISQYFLNISTTETVITVINRFRLFFLQIRPKAAPGNIRHDDDHLSERPRLLL